MNRYEQILTQIVAAMITDGYDPPIAAGSEEARKAASILEAHFKARDRRDLEIMGDNLRKMANLPSLLKRQAE